MATTSRIAATARRAMSLLAMSFLTLSVPVATGPALPEAAAAPTSVSVAPGSLWVAAPAVDDFAYVVLDGTAQATQAALDPFAVTDARGTGQGWVLSLQATPFREWDGSSYVPDGKSLPAGSLVLEGLSVSPEGTDSPVPGLVAGSVALDGPAVTVAAATVGGGMGTYVFVADDGLAVAVPAGAYARTYRSELSISVTSGP